MRNRTIPLVLSLALILALGAAGAAGAAPAKRKAGLSKSAAKLTPSERAGIPPEAFGSPVTAPDRSLVAWITDVGQGANI
ncbi:MAG TPA: hypothetical protein VMS93_09915, partial [Candidatus Saccharimonadales bacterium]|nr:hypothetical protein [Candidatus Saccharimonadales bacterium]